MIEPHQRIQNPLFFYPDTSRHQPPFINSPLSPTYIYMNALLMRFWIHQQRSISRGVAQTNSIPMAQAGSLSAETESLSHIFSLIEAFRAFDGDNDGLITAAEVGGIMASLGYNLSEQDVGLMMEEGDVDKDGLLSLAEFLDMNVKSLEVGEVGGYLKIAYEALKADGDDLVSGEELYDVFVNLGLEVSVEDCNAIVASMDGDGDGAVFLEDLKLVVNSLD